MRAYYEVKTLGEALDLARQFNDTYGVLLVQNVYKSDEYIDCVVIKYDKN